MAKDPAFLFYTGDFTTGTQFFSDEQLGKYLRLLMAQHQLGHLHEKHMMMICKSYDNEVFSKFKKDDQGLYYNERLDIEIAKRKSYTESRSKNKKGKIHSPKGKKQIKSYDYHMENENKDKNIIISEKEINIDFDFFWNDYDKKRGEKSKIKKKWESLSDKERELIMEYIPMYKYSQPDKAYRKDPDTFLNNRAWEDEIIIKGELIPVSKSEQINELVKKHLVWTK